MEANIGLFVSGDRIQKTFSLKELKIKMSSLLNVSNDVSRKSEEFSLKDIEVIVDSKEQNWFKRAHVGQYLGIARIITSTAKLSEEDIRPRAFLQAEGGIYSMDPPREDAHDHDIFISLTGALYVTVNSRKEKGKVLKKHILKDIVPREFDARIEEIKEKHRQAIEEKDATISLLNDDLQKREYENVALQAQKDVYQAELQKYQDIITHLETRYVPHTRNPGKDNIIIIVRKHTTPANDKFHDLPYYVARIQQGKRYVKLRWFDQHFPDHEVIVEIDNVKSIHAFNRFEEERHAERNTTTLD